MHRTERKGHTLCFPNRAKALLGVECGACNQGPQGWCEGHWFEELKDCITYGTRRRRTSAFREPRREFGFEQIAAEVPSGEPGGDVGAELGLRTWGSVECSRPEVQTQELRQDSAWECLPGACQGLMIFGRAGFTTLQLLSSGF